mmetsp:Transcript_31099/g.96824  ORF Transcript_31099/g.96824 Transcript_31099/m.96824 type:complete len:254 (-) Transcript_31099:308-1069(-)
MQWRARSQRQDQRTALPRQGRQEERPRDQRRPQAQRRLPPRLAGKLPPPGATPGRRTGRVSRWLNLKGIGWIRPDDGGDTIFVHFSAISPRAMAQEGQSSLLVDDHVEFDLAPDPNDAARVVAAGVTGIGGSRLRPGYMAGEKVGWRDDGPIKEVYVGNLAFRTTWRDLQSHFRQVGSVSWAGVATDGWDERNSHPFSKGWGTVRFEDAEEARRAITELNGSKLHGREIYVKEYLGGQQNDDEDAFEPLLPWT